MKLSQRAVQLTPSEPRRIYDEAQKYRNVIDLTLGDPDLPPPMNVREAACEAIRAGKTRYSANAGLLALRQAIVAEARKEYGMDFRAESEVIVTVGAMESAYLSLWSLLDEGDEAIIPAPYWINYGEVVKSCGAKPVFIETRPEDAFIVQPKEIEKRITPKTRLLILNSPANPTGAVIPGETLDKLAELAVKYDLTVISDEIYNHLVYDGRKAESILTRGSDGRRQRFFQTLRDDRLACGMDVGAVAIDSRNDADDGKRGGMRAVAVAIRGVGGVVGPHGRVVYSS